MSGINWKMGQERFTGKGVFKSTIVKSKEKYYCVICGKELPLMRDNLTTELFIPRCAEKYAEGKFRNLEPECMEIIEQINIKRIRRAKKEKDRQYTLQVYYTTDKDLQKQTDRII